MTSIPTPYNGINFRSRAEARWAAFFDFAGWEWDYEPVDLDGYIPDFMLRWYKPLLVEVKGGALDTASLYEYTSKIEASGWQNSALIIGAVPERGGDLGIIRRRRSDWVEALPCRCDTCGGSTIVWAKATGRGHPALCLRCGVIIRTEWDETKGCNVMQHVSDWSPTRDWSDACNATQWMPRVSTPRIYAPRLDPRRR